MNTYGSSPCAPPESHAVETVVPSDLVDAILGKNPHPIMHTRSLRYCTTAFHHSDLPVERAAKTRQYHVMDATVLGLLLITASASLAALSPEASEATLFLVLPLIGALLVTGGAILLNPEIETRKITMGRGLFGAVVGVPGPWAFCSLLSYWGLDGLSAFFKLPPLLFLCGAAFCFVAFVLSYPFCRQFYARSEAISKREVDRLERITRPPREE